MQTITPRIALSAEFDYKFYKRWLTHRQMALFILEPHTATYRLLTSDSGHVGPINDELAVGARPQARVLPIGYQTDGMTVNESVFLEPSVVLSPRRKRLCWLSAAGGWFAVTSDFSQRCIREREFDSGLTGYAIWYSDELQWGEPAYSASYKSFTELIVYSATDVGSKVEYVQNLRAGECIGTTVRGTSVVVSTARKGRSTGPNDRQVSQICLLELGSKHPRATRRHVALPVGCAYDAISLAASTERLGWLLSWRGEEGWAQGIWVTDLNGAEVAPLAAIKTDWLPPFVARNGFEQISCHDLEWTPDEWSLSCVFGNVVLIFDLPRLPD